MNLQVSSYKGRNRLAIVRGYRDSETKNVRHKCVMSLGYADGIPISYRLFPGNTNDCKTMLPMPSEAKEAFGIGRTIVVADKGVNTLGNIGSLSTPIS
ncbi:MAG: hypothetical protein LBQ86_04515 [Holophagales bacterium]|nr:hypothetical protein [Holophagales bacterium]